jgi:hypothetical protein
MKQTIRRTAAVAAGIALAGAGALLAAGPANAATGTDISSWVSSYCLHGSGDLYCLWYNQGQGTGGAGWGSTSMVTDTITGTFDIAVPGNSDAGYGVAVRNHAESLSNGSSICYATTFVSPNLQGNWNYVAPSMAGNLSPALVNNEASIELDNCS